MWVMSIQNVYTFLGHALYQQDTTARANDNTKDASTQNLAKCQLFADVYSMGVAVDGRSKRQWYFCPILQYKDWRLNKRTVLVFHVKLVPCR
jgi:hypothetical protein